MYRTRSPFDLLHGTPPSLAILPDHGDEMAFERLAALKKAAAIVLLRSRRRTPGSRSQKATTTGGSDNG